MATAATTPLVNEPIKLTRAVKPKAGTKGAAPIPPPSPPHPLSLLPPKWLQSLLLRLHPQHPLDPLHPLKPPHSLHPLQSLLRPCLQSLR